MSIVNHHGQQKKMALRSHLYYLVASISLVFLLTRISTVWGVILMLIHICISFRLAHELVIQSFPLRDSLIVGILFPINVILYFAAIYYQQGISCAPQDQILHDFWLCLKVSTGNFIGHLVTTCQAREGIGTNVAFFEPVAGWASLAVAGIFIGFVFVKANR